MNKVAIATLGLAVLGLVGCESPLLHQDRPGGSDYHAGSGSSYHRGDESGRNYGQEERRRSDELRDRDADRQDPAARSDDDRYRNRRGY